MRPIGNQIGCLEFNKSIMHGHKLNIANHIRILSVCTLKVQNECELPKGECARFPFSGRGGGGSRAHFLKYFFIFFAKIPSLGQRKLF